MKDLIEKLLRFDEFFAFLIPGFVLMASFFLWIRVDSSNPIWVLLAENELVLLLVVFFASSVLSFAIQRFLDAIPHGHPGHDRGLDDSGELERLIPASAVPRMRRELQKTSSEDVDTLIFDIAEEAHLSFLVSSGVSLSLLAVGIQTVCRLVLMIIEKTIWSFNLSEVLPDVGAPLLFVLTIFAIVGYVQLRRRAVKSWQIEVFLTECLRNGDPDCFGKLLGDQPPDQNKLLR